MGSRLVALAVAAAAACALAASSSAARAELGAYQGLGTWVDIFGKSWADPEAAVAAMGSRGVSTLFLETSNYSQPVDVVRPALTARFIEAAHAEGLQVVAWYLPSMASPARDLRRSLAAMRFTTPDGQGFDSFALDLEASVVRKVWQRRRGASSPRSATAAPPGAGSTTSRRRPRTSGRLWPRSRRLRLPFPPVPTRRLRAGRRCRRAPRGRRPRRAGWPEPRDRRDPR